MSTRTPSWWYQKANALAEAWPGKTPSTYCVLLAIATHETRAGDAWPGEHNWGATTKKGGLSPAQQAAMRDAGIVATKAMIPSSNPAQNAIATALRTLAEKQATALFNDPTMAVHFDTRPDGSGGTIPYFTAFSRFATDVEGARYFASFFHTAAEQAALDRASIDAEADAMYSAGYYKGFTSDRVTNVAAYANACRPLVAECRAALDMWYPGAEPPVYSEPADPSRAGVREVQSLLVRAGAAITVDGAFGPATRAAIKAFQLSHMGVPLAAIAFEDKEERIFPTGYADPVTVLALRA